MVWTYHFVELPSFLFCLTRGPEMSQFIPPPPQVPGLAKTYSGGSDEEGVAKLRKDLDTVMRKSTTLSEMLQVWGGNIVSSPSRRQVLQLLLLKVGSFHSYC